MPDNTPAGFTDGRVPVPGTFLVGEAGPELLTLDGRGGTIRPARAVNVQISQEKIAGIASEEIGPPPEVA